MHNDTLWKAGLARWLAIWLGCALLPSSVLAAATRSARIPTVPKWGCFEQVFKSRVSYTNALQEAVLTVEFVSPAGETNRAQGFWDGGRVWRVRFSPDTVGEWSYTTRCSDAANKGLHRQSGHFLCTAASGLNVFSQHGLVQVAAAHRHLEYSDGTPFFWMADTTWNGARVSRLGDWEVYAATRRMQHFSVVQWAVAPGGDWKDQSAYTGSADCIRVNPEFFQRLDLKVDALRQEGLVNAIAPLQEVLEDNPGAQTLSEEQAVRLVRYVVARYGADPVVWLLNLESSSSAQQAERWKRIYAAVFDGAKHAPVLVYAGGNARFLEVFRSQDWVDVVGCPALKPSAELFRGAIAGSSVREAQMTPVRPVIVFTPCENGRALHQKERFSSDLVRQNTCWNLLAAPMAGVSYSGWGVLNWDAGVVSQGPELLGGNLPTWRKALYLTGAKQLSYLAECVQSVDFSHLQPDASVVEEQPGTDKPAQFILAQFSAADGLTLAYVPQALRFHMALKALPANPSITWLNPRAGNQLRGMAFGEWERSCQLPTYDTNDWLLIVRPVR